MPTVAAEFEAVLGLYRANQDHAESRVKCLVALVRVVVRVTALLPVGPSPSPAHPAPSCCGEAPCGLLSSARIPWYSGVTLFLLPRTSPAFPTPVSPPPHPALSLPPTHTLWDPTPQGKTRVPALVTRYLDWAVNSGEVRSQDLVYALGALSGNVHARTIAWDWLVAHWAELMEKCVAVVLGVCGCFLCVCVRESGGACVCRWVVCGVAGCVAGGVWRDAGAGLAREFIDLLFVHEVLGRCLVRVILLAA
jgi:hypothetical protein